MPSARRVGGADDNAHDLANNERTRRPETIGTEVEDASSLRGAKHREGIKPKPKVTVKKREDDAMLRVRQDIRQPVTSLWQTAAERASTAPSRIASHEGGIMDNTNTTARRKLSRHRPHSQIGVARAKRGIGGADAHGGNMDGCLPASGKGAVSSADGEKGGANRGQPSRESEPASPNANIIIPGIAPTRGLGARANDRVKQGRGTPVPLRSSHRVGPVGSLGGPRSAVLDRSSDSYDFVDLVAFELRA